MFDKYSLEISKVFNMAEKECLSLKHPYVGTEHLMLALLKSCDEIRNISKKYGLEYSEFKNELKNVVGECDKENGCVLYTPLLKRVIHVASEDAGHDNVPLSCKYLFKAIFDEGEGIAIRILFSMEVDIDKLYDSIKVEHVKKTNKNLEIFSIGKIIEDEINLDDVVVGRDKELELLIETLLRKNKNNPILVGEAGVGKTAIVEELVRRIKRGEVPTTLKNKKIVSLELGSLVAGTKYRGEFEEKLTKIIKELESNPDIIVFIDEIHAIVNAGGAEGAINASDILKPYLARGKIKVIGATTTGEYNKYILKDKALTRRFEMIKVIESTNEETIDILNKVRPSFEVHYDIKISDENIKDIVAYSSKYITDRRNPDKAIDTLDSVCAMVSVRNNYDCIGMKLEKEIKKLETKKENFVKKNNFKKASSTQEKIIELKNKRNALKNESNQILRSDILALLGKKVNIPLLEDKEGILKCLAKTLEENILGQEEAIQKILENMQYAFLEKEKPMSLLLTGATGVGKTETVKQIAKCMNMHLIRLDMSEYNLDISLNRLVGAAAGFIGYDDEAVLDQIRMHPYSIVLVDELEKASPAVLNLFLQIMDEGFVTNAQGEKLDFKNTLIFMTSNVVGTKKIGFGKSNVDFGESFSREFLARFDDIVPYKNINEETALLYLKKNNIDDVSILEKINYEKYGLREVNRIIRKNKFSKKNQHAC